MQEDEDYAGVSGCARWGRPVSGMGAKTNAREASGHQGVRLEHLSLPVARAVERRHGLAECVATCYGPLAIRTIVATDGRKSVAWPWTGRRGAMTTDGPQPRS